jgi:threonine synthase
VLTGNLLKDPDYTIEFHRGDLFKSGIGEPAQRALNSLRRPPIVLDATLDAVIRTLEQADTVTSES